MAYSSMILTGLMLTIVGFILLYCKDKATMHPAKTFKKQKFGAGCLCCWEARRLRENLEIELTNQRQTQVDKHETKLAR